MSAFSSGRALLIAGIAASLSGLAFAQQPATTLPEVDAVFAAYDRPDSPGCALGVIRDGAFIYRRGYGMANLEYGLPIGPDTVFRIGSTSKQFTAAAVALLAQDGLVDLDESLRRHFPEFPAWADEVTIRQLIHHTSGIRDYLQLAFLAGRGGDADYYTDEWVLNLLARQRETNFPPGNRFLYSNSGYLLLAHLVRRVTGQSLRRFAEERIFGPLGMSGVHFHDDHTAIVPRRATGYAPRGDGYRISMTTLDMVGDGGVFTSVDALLPWDRNFYDDRLGGGDAFVRELTTSGRLRDGITPVDYAFGLGVDTWRRLERVSHGGSFVGYRAELMRFPGERLSVIVLCNRADANPTRMAEQVAAHLLAGRIEPVPEAAEDQVLSLSPSELERYAGDFWEPEEAFAAEVRVDEGALWAVHSPTRRDPLVPIGTDRFRMTGLPADVIITYTFDEDGTLAHMSRFIDGEAAGRFTPFRKRQATPAELEAYTGTFYSDELDIRYRLFLQDGLLWFEAGDAAAEELTAQFAETFENPDYGSFTFLRESHGAVSGFLLQSGRVRNLRFSREPSRRTDGAGAEVP